MKLRKPPPRTAPEPPSRPSEGRYDDAIVDIQGAHAFLNRMKADSGLARFCHEKMDELETR